MNRILALILLAPLSVHVFAQPDESATKESEVMETLANFIHAFDNLDWEGFRTSFADDATVFYPRAVPQRADGRSEFERNFRQVFEQIRGGKTKGPYMSCERATSRFRWPSMSPS